MNESIFYNFLIDEGANIPAYARERLLGFFKNIYPLKSFEMVTEPKDNFKEVRISFPDHGVQYLITMQGKYSTKKKKLRMLYGSVKCSVFLESNNKEVRIEI